MRAVALLTCAAFLTASVAHAGDRVLPGYCKETREAQLEALVAAIEGADCASAEAIDIDPRVQTHVFATPVFDGRADEFGLPTGEKLLVDVRLNLQPHVAPEAPGVRVFLLEKYKAYKRKKAEAAAAVNAVAQQVGDLQIRYFSVGPSWMRNMNAAATATAVDAAGGLAINAVESIAVLYFPPLAVVQIAQFVEQVADAPSQIDQGFEAIGDGILEKDFDKSANGVAQVCGGVSTIITAAIPLAKAGALAKPRQPITLFGKNGAPVLKPKAPTPASSTALVPYDSSFAASQATSEAARILGRDPVTPNGRSIMFHAADRMVNPPKGRAPMTLEEVDRVLDSGTKIKKINPKNGSVTVQHPGMPGKPQVVVDGETGERVITVIKNTPKGTP